MLKSYRIAAPPAELGPAVQAAIDAKTKPPASLGRIEALALQLALCQHDLQPCAEPARLLLFAADHGLVAEGVSAWPQAVTGEMVRNFVHGGAAANAFARACGASITVIDAGVAGDLYWLDGLVGRRIAAGTRNARREDAMTASERDAALEAGAEVAVTAIDAGARVLLLGEMGIGNSASAALLAHALTGGPLPALTGPGAGLDAAGLAHKIAVLEAAAARRPDAKSGSAALAAFGGFEIAMMSGALVAAAAERTPIVVDGFIASVAALVAIDARPESRPWCVFAHRSTEPGHDAVLQHLAATPLLDLQMRLGEGTGALLALPLLRAACAMLSDMASFENAGVSRAPA